MTDDSIFVGRQPILDRHRRIVAYELLYRDSAAATSAHYDQQCMAATRVIASTFSTLGADAVLGRCKGFVNVTAELLRHDLVSVLPADRVVIEILESVTVDAELIQRCSELCKLGFTLALDDWVPSDPREKLLDLASVVKVDLPAFDQPKLRNLVRRLKRRNLQVLAEKVETQEQFALCHALGFDLFQGYFFARPVTLQGAALDPARSTLMRVLQEIELDASSSEVAREIKRHVKLGVNLLRLVNSAAMARPQPLEKVEDAVTFLGQRQLQRWITILLYAGADDDGIDSPLLQCAAHRGRMMELAAALAGDGTISKNQTERAFLVGMLSLVDALLGRPIEQVVAELGLSAEINDALLKREGPLGKLLELVEAAEGASLHQLFPVANDLGLDVDDVQQAQDESSVWVNSLMCEAA